MHLLNFIMYMNMFVFYVRKTLLVLRGQCRIIQRMSYFQHNYSKEVQNAINKQIEAEQQAAQDYLNMAVVFKHPCVARPGAAGFFMRMYEEELDHMQQFVQYQILRGGMPLINGLQPPKQVTDFTLLNAFKTALAMEKLVTELLENLVCAAETVKDYQCADFVTSVFLAEQVKSLNEMSNHVTKLVRLGDDQHAIYHYDLELEKNYPYQFKKYGQISSNAKP